MRHLAAVVALAMGACVSSAQAQDRPNWAGPYAGLTAGYSTAQLSAPGIDWATAGLQGGVFAGYGVVGSSGLYIGVEADAVLKDIKWQVGDGTSSVTAQNQWVGTMRARIGQQIGSVLVYVTGGAALTDQKISATGLGSDSELRWGFVGGGGIEAMITKTLALRVEGLHTQFPDKAFWLSGTSDKIGTGDTAVRVGVSLKLN